MTAQKPDLLITGRQLMVSSIASSARNRRPGLDVGYTDKPIGFYSNLDVSEMPLNIQGTLQST